MQGFVLKILLKVSSNVPQTVTMTVEKALALSAFGIPFI